MNESYTAHKSPQSTDTQGRIRRLITRQRTSERPAASYLVRSRPPLQTSSAAVQGLLVESWGWGYIS